MWRGRTCGKNSNSLWHELRLGRLTASQFGIVLKACRRNSFPASLFKSLFEQYNVSGVKAVTWGMENEQKEWASTNIPLLLDFYFNRMLPEYGRSLGYIV